MRYTLKSMGVAAAATACVLAAATSTAQAAPTSLYTPSALVLAVGHGEEAATMTAERVVTLNCAPRPSGSHPAPEAACGELRAAEGRFDQLVTSEPQAICTMEWDPVVVTADGYWQGKRVAWSTTFANDCVMRASLTESTALNF
ncbi:subtilase-type protease inhibitor [Streptomyces apocyni]|uniref:subtilase-type protease inhibitor n=1 Tax=Streptomyces apocyni TaxID=2654677 RepID=UPI0012EA306F|nr:subtilase-type protease inhibitor [Streptomyces apocyni]